MLQRPLYGGPFGNGRYSLATMPTVSNGLHAVRFMVLDPQGGAVLSAAFEKLAAIEAARRVLRLAGPLQAANDEAWTQSTLWSDLPFDRGTGLRRATRRRREVFDRSEGRCHYCSCTLALDGVWHVEHQRPRALGGGDDAVNLVAACQACNLSKRDRTALEFFASRDRDPSE
jgi:hypothetical protein